MSPRPRARQLPCLVTSLGLLAAVCILRPPYAAPMIKPWLPPGTDSLTVWAAEARERFQSNAGDTVGGRNYRPYDLVGSMGRRLLASLGRQGVTQAHAIEPVLDSLGLDTEVVTDVQQPAFVLLMVRDPY